MSVFKRWNGTSWETIGPQISSARFDDTNHMIAPEYSSTSTYNVGDYVVQSDKLYKCISAIESAEEWTPARWTQISMGGEVNDLNSALNTIEGDMYQSSKLQFVEKSLAVIGTKFEGYNCTVDSVNNKLILGTNALYDSYSFKIKNNTSIYVDIPASGLFNICVGNDANDDWYDGQYNQKFIDCTDPVRLRRNDGNLPNSSNPLATPINTILVFTVNSSVIPTMYIAEEEQEIKIGFVNAHVTNNELTLSGDNYTVKFEKTTTTQGYQWNITSLKGKGGNVLPPTTDIIGVLRYSGQSNFTGGVHGNEEALTFKAMSNGAEIEDGKSYPTVNLEMTSHLYNPDDTDVVVADRFVNFVFTRNGWTARVTFKTLMSGTIEAAYPSGLFGFVASTADYFITNLGEVDLESSATPVYYNPLLKQAVINIKDNITINITADEYEQAFIAYRPGSNSFKVYWQYRDKVVSVNDYITGICKYTF